MADMCRLSFLLPLVVFIVSVQVMAQDSDNAVLQDDTTDHSTCSTSRPTSADKDDNSACTSTANEIEPTPVDSEGGTVRKNNQSAFKGKPKVIKPPPLGGQLRGDPQTNKQSPLGSNQPHLDQLSQLVNMLNMFGPMLSSMQNDKKHLDKETQAKFDMLMKFLPLLPQIQQFLSNPTASNPMMQIIGSLMAGMSPTWMHAATGHQQCPKPTWRSVILKTPSKPLVDKDGNRKLFEKVLPGHTADEKANNEGKKPGSYTELFSILANSLGLGNAYAAKTKS